MLLTLTCETDAATDLGYLLHKNPANVFSSEHWFGTAKVFYPEATDTRCTAALLLEIDPIELVRGKRAFSLDQYVNTRPYVASSLLCVAMAEAFGTAMNGRSKERPARVEEKMSLTLRIAALDCGDDSFIERMFAPLGYEVTLARPQRDPNFPEWGDSPIATVTLKGEQTVQDALTHLYVLIPVLDNEKHYFVGDAETEKLLEKGERWLPTHPEKEIITRRYLKYKQKMVRDALNQLTPPLDETALPNPETDDVQAEEEAAKERPMRLNDARMNAALEAAMTTNPPPKRVIDLGCGEGRLLQMLLREGTLSHVTGVDVSARVLENAARRLKLDAMTERQRARISLLNGSLVYRDARFSGYDVATLIEVIEHLDSPRLSSLEKVVFGAAQPRRVIITTPNQEYNVVWESLPAEKMRHRDHRFEWTRAQFAAWAEEIAKNYDYRVELSGIGEVHEAYGTPTQMAIFDREEKS